jgi:hypothetical protein
MKTTIVATLLIAALASPASADVTLKQTTSGKGLGLSNQMEGTTYIKGNKMRSDAVVGDRTLSTIFDLDAQKMLILDSKKKTADVWDMAAFSAELAQTVDVSQAKASLTPTGQSKQIAGQDATGYALEVSMPATVAGSADMAMMVKLSGPVWIVKDAPGSADYIRFYKAAAEKGWVMSDPRAAKASPGPARAMTEMYRQFADAGGIAYEVDTQITMSPIGNNPLGALLGRMGNVSMATVTKSVETVPVADDLFAAPADYKLNEKN